MPSESSRERLPFEPGSKGADKKAKETKKVPKAPSQTKRVARSSTAAKKAAAAKTAQGSNTIPKEVSDRMLRRMLAFSGIPTALGVLTFFISYYLVVNRVVELPSYFVLLITLACFGLGVVGLTYGVLSASWDEGRSGNRLGLDEFKVNFGRVTSAWGANSER
ncbi:MAG: PAM68 family protein [Nodosilinea sp.]